VTEDGRMLFRTSLTNDDRTADAVPDLHPVVDDPHQEAGHHYDRFLAEGRDPNQRIARAEKDLQKAQNKLEPLRKALSDARTELGRPTDREVKERLNNRITKLETQINEKAQPAIDAAERARDAAVAEGGRPSDRANQGRMDRWRAAVKRFVDDNVKPLGHG